MEDSDNKEAVIDEVQLSKSWNASIEALKKSIEDTSDEDLEALEKARKKPKKKAEDYDMEDDDEEDDYEDSEEDIEEDIEEDMKGNKKMKKSLEDYISEDSEADIAMDVEPYLRSLAKSIDKVIANKFKNIEILVSTKLEKVSKSLNLQSKALIAGAELQKAMEDKIVKIGKTPIPSSTVLKKSIKISGDKEMSMPQVMQKAMDLCKKGRLSNSEVSIIESRLQKGIDLPDTILSKLNEGGN